MYVYRLNVQIAPFLTNNGRAKRAQFSQKSLKLYSTTRGLMTQIAMAVFGKTGDRLVYTPSAKATTNAMMEQCIKSMLLSKWFLRLTKLSLADPAYMEARVAIVEQMKASVLAIMNAWKANVPASVGVPPFLLVSAL